MKPEELLKKLERLDEIPSKGYNIRGKPNSIQTVFVDGELLVPRWHKRCQQLKINLIDNFKKDELSDFLDFLLKEGYCDTDVYYEPPTALDQYLIFNKKTTNKTE